MRKESPTKKNHKLLNQKIAILSKEFLLPTRYFYSFFFYYFFFKENPFSYSFLNSSQYIKQNVQKKLNSLRSEAKQIEDEYKKSISSGEKPLLEQPKTKSLIAPSTRITPQEFYTIVPAELIQGGKTSFPVTPKEKLVAVTPKVVNTQEADVVIKQTDLGKKVTTTLSKIVDTQNTDTIKRQTDIGKKITATPPMNYSQNSNTMKKQIDASPKQTDIGKKITATPPINYTQNINTMRKLHI